MHPIGSVAQSEFKKYDDLAADLLSHWKKCGLSKTYKIHWATVHAPEFVRRNGMAIGFITEQGIESLHAVWAKYDDWYKSNDRILAVLRWNRLHIDNLPAKVKSSKKVSS